MYAVCTRNQHMGWTSTSAMLRIQLFVKLIMSLGRFDADIKLGRNTQNGFTMLLLTHIPNPSPSLCTYTMPLRDSTDHDYEII